MPAKLNLYKRHQDEYIQPKTPALVRVKPAKYLALDGQGAPASPVFASSIGALYGVAYTLKMAKKQSGQDYRVCGLEGFWWGAQSGHDFFSDAIDTWCWKLVIRVPEFITSKDVKSAAKYLVSKGKPGNIANVALAKISEGRCVQMLHIGPYTSETTTIEKMMAYAREQHLDFHGLHHELYLSDPRRVPPERLKTILRMPVRKAL